MSVRLLLTLFALLLPSPVAAGCVLFKELVELDEKARRYLRASPIEVSDRAALTIAVVVVDHMLEGFDSGGLAEFLGVRRHLATSDVSELSDMAHEEFLVRLHRTRRELPQYGESWGCLGRSAEENAAGQPGGVGSVPTSSDMLGRSLDQHRSVPQPPRSNGTAPAASGYLYALWLVLGGGVAIFCLAHWEARRSFMLLRHICNVPSVVEAGAERVEVTILDLSMVGAKVKIDRGAMPPTPCGASHLVLHGRRVAFDVVWRTSRFVGVRFKNPIPRKLVIHLSSGLQTLAGADARRKPQSVRQNAVSGRTAGAPVTGSARSE